MIFDGVYNIGLFDTTRDEYKIGGCRRQTTTIHISHMLEYAFWICVGDEIFRETARDGQANSIATI